MDRKTSARNEPLRTLGDEELTLVTGACHGRRRHHRRRHECGNDGGEDLATAGPGSFLSSLSSLLQQANVSNIFQIILGDVFGSVTMVAASSQSNSGVQA